MSLSYSNFMINMMCTNFSLNIHRNKLDEYSFNIKVDGVTQSNALTINIKCGQCYCIIPFDFFFVSYACIVQTPQGVLFSFFGLKTYEPTNPLGNKSTDLSQRFPNKWRSHHYALCIPLFRQIGRITYIVCYIT